ncbi:hypothetical protein TNCV_3546311 [Trichonephila clavipes]|nr:hypothetical protein TNCV_3546311 [Trichonephila clavipes]
MCPTNDISLTPERNQFQIIRQEGVLDRLYDQCISCLLEMLSANIPNNSACCLLQGYRIYSSIDSTGTHSWDLFFLQLNHLEASKLEAGRMLKCLSWLP